MINACILILSNVWSALMIKKFIGFQLHLGLISFLCNIQARIQEAGIEIRRFKSKLHSKANFAPFMLTIEKEVAHY